jgi:hypothetical protein
MTARALFAAAVLLCAAACSQGPRAFAGQVQSRSELVGGPRAIGEVGDWRLSNGRVRFIVQDKGSARVYGTFGGSLIDADLERPGELDPKGRPLGKDGLGELFPAYFLSAVEPTKIQLIDDGSAGGTARIRVSGKQSEFLTSTKFIDDATIGSGLSFAVDYALGPADDFLTITSSVVNERISPHTFPAQTSSGSSATGSRSSCRERRATTSASRSRNRTSGPTRCRRFPASPPACSRSRATASRTA